MYTPHQVPWTISGTKELMQQTDGNASSHKPFTPECNAWGKITPKEVLQAIKDSYDNPTCRHCPTVATRFT